MFKFFEMDPSWCPDRKGLIRALLPKIKLSGEIQCLPVRRIRDRPCYGISSLSRCQSYTLKTNFTCHNYLKVLFLTGPVGTWNFGRVTNAHLALNSNNVVVSIGVNHTFKVIFTLLEYVPTIPPLSSYIISICLYLAKILCCGLSFCLKVQNKYWWRRMKKQKSQTKKVGSFCHSQNILQWCKNDFKSMIYTNGDY